MSLLIPTQAQRRGLWSVVALLPLLGILGAGPWFVSAAGRTSACGDSTCPAGDLPAQAGVTGRDCCPPGEVCPDCLPVAKTAARVRTTDCCDSVCPLCEAGARARSKKAAKSACCSDGGCCATKTTAAKQYICPPCPFCPGW